VESVVDVVQIVHSIFCDYTTALVVSGSDIFDCAFIISRAGFSLGNVCFRQTTPIIRMARDVAFTLL
jgi:hypothetical protein